MREAVRMFDFPGGGCFSFKTRRRSVERGRMEGHCEAFHTHGSLARTQMTLDSLTDSDLAAHGLADPGRARRLLFSLAGQGVTDDIVGQLLPSLLDALRESPDPDRALNNFVRWIESVTSRYTQVQYLLRHPAAQRIFFNVCGVSQFFSDILVRNPEYFEILANPGVRGSSGGDAPRHYYRELSGFVDRIVRVELKLEAMRRFK